MGGIQGSDLAAFGRLGVHNQDPLHKDTLNRRHFSMVDNAPIPEMLQDYL